LTPDGLRFGAFTLDPANRRLTRDGEVVEINGRYLDALILMVRRPGQLVSKDQFLDEVWRGVPVTDEALTQCIRTLRKQLGDTAGRPRFIETVPKHGYRFIAAVSAADVEPAEPQPTVAAPEPASPDSPYDLKRTLLLGGAAVGIGMAATGLGRRQPSPWIIFGGALGGMTVGGAVKLLGLDAFNLLVGRSPGDITGGMEGFILGGAIGRARPGGGGPNGQAAPPAAVSAEQRLD